MGRILAAALGIACLCLSSQTLAARLKPWLEEAPEPYPPVISPLPEQKVLESLARHTEWLERWGKAIPSLSWTEETLDLIVKYRQNPLRASRSLTYVNVAVHDALAYCERRQCSDAASRVAMHTAGGIMLEHLYPEEIPTRMRALGYSASVAVAVALGTKIDDFDLGWTVGSLAANAAMIRAVFDGSDEEWDINDRPTPAHHIWKAAPPLFIHNPVEGNAGKWKTWVLNRPDEIEIPPPTPYGSEAYWAEMREVLEVTKNLTPEQKRIAEEWNLDQGTVTPAGVWNKRAMALSREHRMDVYDTARMMAAVNVAMMDAFIACWHYKMKWWTPRPITVIREYLDPTFTPHLLTPGFPGYPSGHATVSGAAACLLDDYFRKSKKNQVDAKESGESRLFGGIHTRSENSAGVRLGEAVGSAVSSRGEASSGSRIADGFSCDRTTY